MITNAYRFPVSVRWLEGRQTEASVHGKPPLHVATPPEFRGGVTGVWSPEDLLVGAAASCYTVTLVAVAERRGVPIRGLTVEGSGLITQRDDGRLGFTLIELLVELDTEPGHEEAAERAAQAAEKGCFVSMALDVPLRVHVQVRVHEATLA